MFEPFIRTLSEQLNSKFILFYLIDQLELILNENLDDDQNGEQKNLTIKYYTRKLLRYVRHLHLKRCWLNYLE